MIPSLLSRLIILLFGTLYPAYASYKTVKTKNVREYVKWMMYWIVFALFTTVETFTDIFFSWFPFYYEIKIVTVIWLLSPATKGSSILYRRFVHPMLSSKEQEIDEYISKAKEQSYKQVLDIGQKGVNMIMQTAMKKLDIISVAAAVKAGDQTDGPAQSFSNFEFPVDSISEDEDIDIATLPDIKAKEGRPKGRKRIGTRKSSRKVRKTDSGESLD